MPPFRSPAALCCLAIVLAPAAAQARPNLAANRAAVAQAISDCRKLTDRDARLDCYDKAADAFDQAEAAGQVVVVDRTQMQAVKRQAFGFSMPSLNMFSRGAAHDAKEDRVDVIDVKLASAHQDPTGKWVFTTDEDAVWRQIDTTELNNDPRPGDPMVVRRAMLGSFFCKVGHEAAVRCARAQ